VYNPFFAGNTKSLNFKSTPKHLFFMTDTGYSGTPLIKKLGIKEGVKLLLINAPENYFDLLKINLSGQLVSRQETPDFIHLFAQTRKEFEKGMKTIEPYCKKNREIIIWVSWYKKSSGMVSDISENDIRNYALQNDLVDIKICAVSELWSGLKLVIPLAKR
jgi:hypothetical protein